MLLLFSSLRGEIATTTFHFFAITFTPLNLASLSWKKENGLTARTEHISFFYMLITM